MFNIGIIGTGMISESHAKAILKDGRGNILWAVYGSRRERGEEFAQKFGAANITDNWRELLAVPELDMVCVCTPSGTHGEIATEFLKRGVSVLCEKPLDIDSAVIDKMILAADESGAKLGCVFSNRTRLGLMRARKLIESGELGQKKVVYCEYRGYRKPAYYTSSNWKGTKRLDGGGVLMNQGIHAVDAMMYLTGGDVTEVCADVGAVGRNIEVEDTANAILRFSDGAKGILIGTVLSHLPEIGPENDRIRIECEKGSILYAEGKTTLFKNHSTEEFEVEKRSLDEQDLDVELSSGSRPEDVDNHSFDVIISNFIDSIEGKAEILIPARSARRAADLILAIYRSSEKHGWETVNYGV